MTAHNIVCIDNNKRVLAYFLDSFGTQFRYTSNQRDVESRCRFYNQYRKKVRREMGMDELEANIPSHKTTDKEKFALYIDHMSEIEGRMTKFYSQAWHTKLRWKTKVNRQRSEGRLVRNMKDLFGKKAVYIMGDWSDGGRTMKNNQPS